MDRMAAEWGQPDLMKRPEKGAGMYILSTCRGDLQYYLALLEVVGTCHPVPRCQATNLPLRIFHTRYSSLSLLGIFSLGHSGTLVVNFQGRCTCSIWQPITTKPRDRSKKIGRGR